MGQECDKIVSRTTFGLPIKCEEPIFATSSEGENRCEKHYYDYLIEQKIPLKTHL